MAGVHLAYDIRRHLGPWALLGTALIHVALSASVASAQAQFASAPAAPDGRQVVDVRVRGNRNVAANDVLKHVRTRAGRPYQLELVEADVRRLNKTRMFVDVQPYTQQTDNGLIVIFEVRERPYIQYVKYVGNEKIKRKILQRETELEPGDALDPFAVEEGRRKLEEWYHSHGFTQARVSIVEGSKVDDRGVIYLINEGQKQKILWTRFVGNTIASDSRLRTQIKSKPPILYLFKGEVDRQQIDEDVNRLTAYYRSLGFFRARVGRELEFGDDGKWLTLTFVIDEGPRYTIRNVSFIGNEKFSSSELGEELELAGGEHFNQAEMTADVAKIQEKYGSIGYIFADVQADPRFLEEPGRLDLVYDISEGDRYRVGRIDVDIAGEYPHTKVTTVLNRISLVPGDIVDIRELRASERRLRASGLFENDPARGIAPKIVFSPPELDEADGEMARQRDAEPRYRGQSPRPPRHHRVRRVPSGGNAAADRVVDLRFQGRWSPETPAETPPRSEATTEPTAQPARPAAHPGPGEQGEWTAGRRPIIRGQYTPSAERSTPPLRSSTQYMPRQAAPADDYSYTPPPQGTASPDEDTTTSGSDGSPRFGPILPPGNSTSGAGRPAPLQPPPSRPAPLQPPRSMPAEPQPTYGRQVPPGPDRPFIGGNPGPGQPLPTDGIIRRDSPFARALTEEPTRDITLNPQLQETQTGRLMFGVGVNSDAGLVGSIVVDEQNFDWTRFPRSFEDIRNATAWRGAGQRFRMEAVPGTEVQRYMINFQEPYLLNTNVSLALSGYFYDRRYVDWDEQRVGGRVALGYQFTHDLSGTLAFRGMKININDPSIVGVPELDEVVGDNALYGFEVGLKHDTRDSAFLPTEGHLVELSAEQVIGSFQYPRTQLELRQYFLLHQRPDGSGRHTLSLGTTFGWTGNDTPLYEHFYAGGFSTIRGFDFRGASPRNGGVVVGGHFQLLASAEYMFPITADDMLRGVVFCDTGTVEPTIDNWTDDYRVSPGFGLRIVIPAMGPAPIALDFAFPAVNNAGDDIENFSFFIGFGR
jgi:outer membrane protein insertion porin family